MNLKLLEDEIVKSESGDETAAAVVREVLKPLPSDTVADIMQKQRIYTRLNFIGSMTFKDAEYHREIDKTYSEQIHSLLTTGRPKYRGIIIIGFRESAKTSRVKFNQAYLNCYLHEIVDYINVMSADGSLSAQFTMDMFNIFAVSKLSRYFGQLIAGNVSSQKEKKTMRRFTTTTDVTYSAFSALQTTRGSAQTDIGEDGEVYMKRPKLNIFDDIENETTIRSLVKTDHIRSIVEASILGMDQISGFWLLLGNYLSLRGNIAHFLKKFRDDPSVKIIEIPIDYTDGTPTWGAKYCKTDAEQAALAAQGINKASIETIRRDNPLTFETEYRNNPSRSSVYFDDAVVAKIDESQLVSDLGRTPEGLLIIEEPTVHDRYIMGVDCGKGVGADHSAFTIFKSTGAAFEEVANFYSNTMKPEVFTPFSLRYAEKYNTAFVVPENNYPGNEYVYIAKQSYKNIYKEGEEGAEVYGVSTNLKTKPEMFVRSKTLLTNSLIKIRSLKLYRQIMEYPNDAVSTIKRDGDGGHFDLLMSAVLALFKAQTRASDDSDAIDEMLLRINRNRQQEVESRV